MKATIEFDDLLYRQLKITAIHRGSSIKKLVHEGIRLVLKSPTLSPSKKKQLPLIVSHRKTPLIIPDDIASQLEAEE